MSQGETRDQLVDAALVVLADRGLHGMTLRAVSAEADSALGLVNYHFADKDALIIEAYQKIVDRLTDASRASVEGARGPEDKVIAFIGTAFDPAFLNSDYLTLRLSLWAAASNEPSIAEVNTRLDQDYWVRLTELVAAARPGVSHQDASDRATDIMVAQNGIWLSWIVRPDEAALARCLEHCRSLALD